MLPIHDEDHLFSTKVCCEVNQIKERSLGEFVDRDISQPDEEFLTLLFVDAREGPACLLASDPGSRIYFKILGLSVLQLQKVVHGRVDI